MVDTDTITERLDQLERARAQDMRVSLTRFDALEADITRAEKHLTSAFVAAEYNLSEVESRLSAHITRLENKIDALATMLHQALPLLEWARDNMPTA